MKTDFKKLATDDVVLDWGRAESKTRLVRRGLRSEVVVRIECGSDTPIDALEIRQKIREERGDFLGYFVSSPIPWYEARFQIQEIRTVYLNNYFKGSPKNRFLKTIEELSRTDDDYQIVDFDPGRVIGRPIFVAINPTGPWQILEGTHRCCSHIRRADVLKCDETEIDVIVGVSPAVAAWPSWRNLR